MLGSITPLGERGHARRWSRTMSLYLLGSVVGGALAGGLAGLLGVLLLDLGLGALGVELGATAVLVVLGLLTLLGVALDLRLGGARLPTVHRQVNEDWLSRYRGWVIGTGFGVQLGLGVVTIVTTATVYLTLAAALLSSSVPAGLTLGAVFGAARALPLLAARRVSTPARLREQHLRLARWEPLAHATALGAQVAAVVLITVTAVALGGAA